MTMNKKEAETKLTALRADYRSTTWCPIAKMLCRAHCVCYNEGQVYPDSGNKSASASWSIASPRCTCFMLTGEKRK